MEVTVVEVQALHTESFWTTFWLEHRVEILKRKPNIDPLDKTAAWAGLDEELARSTKSSCSVRPDNLCGIRGSAFARSHFRTPFAKILLTSWSEGTSCGRTKRTTK